MLTFGGLLKYNVLIESELIELPMKSQYSKKQEIIHNKLISFARDNYLGSRWVYIYVNSMEWGLFKEQLFESYHILKRGLGADEILDVMNPKTCEGLITFVFYLKEAFLYNTVLSYYNIKFQGTLYHEKRFDIEFLKKINPIYAYNQRLNEKNNYIKIFKNTTFIPYGDEILDKFKIYDETSCLHILEIKSKLLNIALKKDNIAN